MLQLKITWTGHLDRSLGPVTWTGHLDRSLGPVTWTGHLDRSLEPVTWTGHLNRSLGSSLCGNAQCRTDTVPGGSLLTEVTGSRMISSCRTTLIYLLQSVGCTR